MGTFDLNEMERVAYGFEQAEIQGREGASKERWRQADEVCRRLKAGESSAQIAATWTNLKTGKPYSTVHVNLVARTWRAWERSMVGPNPPSERPLWRDAYNRTAASGRGSRGSKGEKRDGSWLKEMFDADVDFHSQVEIAKHVSNFSVSIAAGTRLNVENAWADGEMPSPEDLLEIQRNVELSIAEFVGTRTLLGKLWAAATSERASRRNH